MADVVFTSEVPDDRLQQLRILLLSWIEIGDYPVNDLRFSCAYSFNSVQASFIRNPWPYTSGSIYVSLMSHDDRKILLRHLKGDWEVSGVNFSGEGNMSIEAIVVIP